MLGDVLGALAEVNGQQSRGWHRPLPHRILCSFQVNSSVCLGLVEEPGQFLDHVLDNSAVYARVLARSRLVTRRKTCQVQELSQGGF